MKKTMFFGIVIWFIFIMGSTTIWAESVSEIFKRKDSDDLQIWSDRIINYIKTNPSTVTAAIRDKSLDYYNSVTAIGIIGADKIDDPLVINDLIAILEDKRETGKFQFWQNGDAIGYQEHLRGEAAFALGAIANKSATDALIRALNDESMWVQGLAINGLGMLKDSKATPFLINVFKKYEGKLSQKMSWQDEFVSMRIVRALGRMDDERAVNILAGLVEHKKICEEYKTDVFFAFGDLGSKTASAVPILLKELDRNTERKITERGILIESLGKTKDRRAVDPLIKELERGDSYIAFEAANALAEIGDPKAIKAMEKALKRKTIKADWSAYEDIKKAYKKLTGKEYKE